MKLYKLQTSAKTRSVNDPSSRVVRKRCFEGKLGKKMKKVKEFFSKLGEINGFAMEKKGYKKVV